MVDRSLRRAHGCDQARARRGSIDSAREATHRRRRWTLLSSGIAWRRVERLLRVHARCHASDRPRGCELVDEHQSCIALHQQPDRRSRWPERSWLTIDNCTFTIRGADGVGQSRTIGSAEEPARYHEHFGLVFHAGMDRCSRRSVDVTASSRRLRAQRGPLTPGDRTRIGRLSALIGASTAGNSRPHDVSVDCRTD